MHTKIVNEIYYAETYSEVDIQKLCGIGEIAPEDLDMEADGILQLDEPFPGTQYFDALANDYDFYGDVPAQIKTVAIENDRMPKEIFFIPAFLLLLLIVMLQSRRATQPAF